MKTKLNVNERMAALSVIPKEGGFIELRVIKELNAKLEFTPAEVEKLQNDAEMKSMPNGGITWNPKKEFPPKEFDFRDSEISILKIALKRLEGEKKLTLEHLPLYEKIVEGGDSGGKNNPGVQQ